jgi:hypothetical protein
LWGSGCKLRIRNRETEREREERLMMFQVSFNLLSIIFISAITLFCWNESISIFQRECVTVLKEAKKINCNTLKTKRSVGNSNTVVINIVCLFS